MRQKVLIKFRQKIGINPDCDNRTHFLRDYSQVHIACVLFPGKTKPNNYHFLLPSDSITLMFVTLNYNKVMSHDMFTIY